MNENVSIKEGNITRKFAPIDKVKVDNTDGTQSIWVPEDDLKTGVLYASDNGIYIASEDGYDAYSEVVIRVEKRIDDGDLIDESNTDWEDIDFDGDVGDFDELDNWDVDTLEEFSDDLEGFDDLFNDEDKWDEEKEKPITEDEMGDFDGDSISGIDPETGNEVEYNVDEDGFLDEEVLPSSIVITRDPFRLTYLDKQTIFFNGILVTAYKNDGSVWTDSSHQNGNIPIGELMFPDKVAKYEGGISGKISDLDYGLDGRPIPSSGSFEVGEGKFTNNGVIYEPWGIYTWTGDNVVAFSNNEVGKNIEATKCLIASSSQSTGEFTSLNTYSGQTNQSTINVDNQYTHNGKTVYWKTSAHLGVIGAADHKVRYITGQIVAPFGNDYNFEEIAWTMVYGEEVDEECYQTVPVQWIRHDGEMLETSFTIIVYPKKSGGGGESESGGESDGGDSVLDDNGKFTWKGKNYKANTDIDATVHFSNGIIWVEAGSWGSREYTVDQAYDLGLITIDN